MRINPISGHHGTGNTVAAAFWVLTAILAVLAFGDALTLLAVALMIVTTARWVYHEVEHRVTRNDAEVAPVTHLRPALIGRRDLETSQHASWWGSSAA